MDPAPATRRGGGPAQNLALYLLGLVAIGLALLSPIDALGPVLLTMHMLARGVSRTLTVVILIAVLGGASVLGPAVAHEDGQHGDPELLNHWRVQAHLLLQWAHLVAFALWVGGLIAATRLPGLRLESLLFASWGLFLVSLGTGSYNMEFSAATPDAPDILSLPGLRARWQFGDAYIILVGVKQALLTLAALWTAGVTILHLRRPTDRDRRRLRAVFLGGVVIVGLTLAAVTSMVLVLHEAIDLAPTPLHSLGGVLNPRGPHEFERAMAARDAAPPPYGTDTRVPAAGFRLFTIPAAAGDAAARFGHLVGFALWLGGTAGGLVAPCPIRRVLPLLWLGLAVQLVTGAYQMTAWTPFAVVPFPWRLATMAEFRFGYTYTWLLALKLGLVMLAVAGTVALAVAARRGSDGSATAPAARLLGWVNLLVGLAIAYVAVALLLVHEGVDHAL